MQSRAQCYTASGNDYKFFNYDGTGGFYSINFKGETVWSDDHLKYGPVSSLKRMTLEKIISSFYSDRAFSSLFKRHSNNGNSTQTQRQNLTNRIDASILKQLPRELKAKLLKMLRNEILLSSSLQDTNTKIADRLMHIVAVLLTIDDEEAQFQPQLLHEQQQQIPIWNEEDSNHISIPFRLNWIRSLSDSCGEENSRKSVLALLLKGLMPLTDTLPSLQLLENFKNLSILNIEKWLMPLSWLVHLPSTIVNLQVRCHADQKLVENSLKFARTLLFLRIERIQNTQLSESSEIEIVQSFFIQLKFLKSWDAFPFNLTDKMFISLIPFLPPSLVDLDLSETFALTQNSFLELGKAIPTQFPNLKWIGLVSKKATQCQALSQLTPEIEGKFISIRTKFEGIQTKSMSTNQNMPTVNLEQFFSETPFFWRLHLDLIRYLTLNVKQLQIPRTLVRDVIAKLCSDSSDPVLIYVLWDMCTTRGPTPLSEFQGPNKHYVQFFETQKLHKQLSSLISNVSKLQIAPAHIQQAMIGLLTMLTFNNDYHYKFLRLDIIGSISTLFQRTQLGSEYIKFIYGALIQLSCSHFGQRLILTEIGIKRIVTTAIEMKEWFLYLRALCVCANLLNLEIEISNDDCQLVLKLIFEAKKFLVDNEIPESVRSNFKEQIFRTLSNLTCQPNLLKFMLENENSEKIAFVLNLVLNDLYTTNTTISNSTNIYLVLNSLLNLQRQQPSCLKELLGNDFLERLILGQKNSTHNHKAKFDIQAYLVLLSISTPQSLEISIPKINSLSDQFFSCLPNNLEHSFWKDLNEIHESMDEERREFVLNLKRMKSLKR